MFGEAELEVRLVLLGEGQEIGAAGMAIGAELNRSTSTIRLQAGVTADIGMLLHRGELGTSFRVIGLDPANGEVLVQSSDIQIGELL